MYLLRFRSVNFYDKLCHALSQKDIIYRKKTLCIVVRIRVFWLLLGNNKFTTNKKTTVATRLLLVMLSVVLIKFSCINYLKLKQNWSFWKNKQNLPHFTIESMIGVGTGWVPINFEIHPLLVLILTDSSKKNLLFLDP